MKMVGGHVSKAALAARVGVGFAVLVLNKSKKTARMGKYLICMLMPEKDVDLRAEASLNGKSNTGLE